MFAAGDATTVPFKQIVIAMGAGSTAALSAFDYLIRHSAPAAIKTAANARDVPYQSLIKVWLQEKVQRR